MLTVLPLLLLGCGVKRYLPGTAVLDATDLIAFDLAPPPPACSAGRRVDMPLLPVQIFGFYYGLDLVIVSRNTGWDMHEYARVDLPEGPLWLAKDSRPDGVQTITADLEDIDSWLPEAAVPRRQGQVRVEDRSEGREVDVSLAYDNPDGQAVEVQVQGRMPKKPPAKRNGSTMGHSRQAAAVVLDLERFGSARRVRMVIDGERVRVKRLLGLVPLRFLLQQAQAGVMVANFRQRPVQGGFEVIRPGPEAVDPADGRPGWPTEGVETWAVETSIDPTGRRFEVATRSDERVTLRYTFIDGGLARAEALQVGRDDPVTVLHLSPPLPDLACASAVAAESRFDLEVNGLRGHGTGTLRVQTGDAGQIDVQLRPDAPWWLADRPMDGELRLLADGEVWTRTWRVPVP